MTSMRQSWIDGMAEVTSAVDEARRQLDKANREEEAVLSANPWPRWRCRIGWHRAVLVRYGMVNHLFWQRYNCGGRCGAFWLSCNFGPLDRVH